MLHLDGVIVGAGILGMLIGLEITEAFSDLDLVILEKEKFVGEHSSSRNSGVLHAGIYYPSNSFKRRFCIEGNKQWFEIQKKFDMGAKRCGKYLIAINEEEIPLLEALTHEIRTPLSTIRTLIRSILKRDDLSNDRTL